MFVHDFIRHHLLESIGIFDMKPQKVPPLEELSKTEWSSRFEKLMRNRLIMGAIRYGCLHAKGKPKYDRIKSIRHRLELYEKDGNGEHLVDVSNLSLLEFEEPNHPNFHFSAQDGGHHTSVIKE
jgi:hypothetical protein